jgi:predicted dehydrogenase
MLDDIKPDVIFIAVPPHQHGEIENAIIDLGIPFQVEKPMALDLGVAEQILARVEEKGLLTNVGFQDRWQNLTETMKDFCEEHTPVVVRGSWLGGIPGVWWWRQQETCGGQIIEQNIHLFDQLRFLFGEPESVYCAGANGLVDEEYGMPGYNLDLDYSSAVMKFKNGVVATLFTGCYNRPGAKVTNGMTVYCKDGTLEYSLRSTLDIYTAEGQTHMDRGEEQTGIMDRVFIDAIKTGDGSKIRSPYSDAIKSLKLTMACEESAKTGEVIKL